MGRIRVKHRASQNTTTAFIILALLFSPLLVAEELVDRISAVVNGEPILHSEIQDKIRRGQIISVASFPAKQEDSDWEKALQDEINFELVLQKISDLELSVSDDDVEREIDRLLKSRNFDRERLNATLQQQGVSYDQYKADFRDQLLIRKFQGRVINPLVKITDKDVETYYLKKTGTTADSVNVALRQIFISIPEGSNTSVQEAKKKRADEVMEKLDGGANFEEMAKIYSDQPGASDNGGKMPEVKLNELASFIRKEVGALEVGKFTEPISGPLGLYIFYMEGRSFSGSSDFNAQKRRLEFELRNVELQSQTQKWLSEQRRKSKIDILK